MLSCNGDCPHVLQRRPAGVVKTRSSARRITSMIAAALAPIYVNSCLGVDRPSPAGGPEPAAQRRRANRTAHSPEAPWTAECFRRRRIATCDEHEHPGFPSPIDNLTHDTETGGIDLTEPSQVQYQDAGPLAEGAERLHKAQGAVH